MRSSSIIEISKSAFQNNLTFIKDYIGADVVFSSVVKGNAYGHGIEQFVPLAEGCGVSSFSVFGCNEAYRVQQATTKNASIIIMGMIDNSELEWAIENDIEFFVFETDRLIHAMQEAKKQNKKAKIHIELETGLNRTGFNKKELDEVIQLCQLHKEHIHIVGFCSHYAGAESIANDSRIKKQIKRFKKNTQYLNEQGIKADINHTACSAATMSYPKTQMGMVRIGIMQYGFWSSKETFIRYLNKQKSTQSPLKRIISWKSKVMATKEIKQGNFVGYGNSYLAIADMKIAIVPVGYSHGYSRILSNQGRVLINGTRVSVIGTVNMNALAIDVTEVPNVEKGNKVILIGEEGDLEVSVASFSELTNQLNYELLTRLPQDIPRKIVE